MFPRLSTFHGQRVLLLAHASADLDAIGSCIALHFALERTAQPVIGLVDRANRPAAELARLARVSPAPIQNLVPFDAILLLDFHSADMAGNLAPVLQALSDHVYGIDHHERLGASLVAPSRLLLDTACPANTQLVYEYLRKNKSTISPEQALAIVGGLVSDTTRFRRANARTFDALSHLINRLPIPYDELVRRLEQPADFSQKHAILLALSRAHIERVGPWLLATSNVSAFGPSAADELIAAGADLALVESTDAHHSSLHGRASPALQSAGYSLPLHLFLPLENAVAGSGGGHDGAGTFKTRAPETTMRALATTIAKRSLQGLGRETSLET